ncbi:sigma factor [Brucella pseudogrignonensis]
MSWDIQELFRRHAKGIARSLRRRGLDPETAADLTQDTFVKVLASQPSNGTPGHNPKAYLYHVAGNFLCAFNRGRNESRLFICVVTVSRCIAPHSHDPAGCSI